MERGRDAVENKSQYPVYTETFLCRIRSILPEDISGTNDNDETSHPRYRLWTESTTENKLENTHTHVHKKQSVGGGEILIERVQERVQEESW